MEDEAESDFYLTLALMLKAKGVLVEGEVIKFKCSFNACMRGDDVEIDDMYLGIKE